MLATDGTWREADSTRAEWRALERSLLAASLAFALALGSFLCARRLTGAAPTPLGPAPLAATAAIILLWALVLRLRLRFALFAWLTACAVALFALGCSYPGGRLIDWLTWGSVALVLGWTNRAAARHSSPAIGYFESDTNEHLLQRVSRLRTMEGGETVQGTLVAEFSPGERTATLHVGFCPPFEFLPEVEVEPVDGPDCSVKIEQVLHQGARFEVRLTHASTATERLAIEFIATETSPPAIGDNPLAV